MLPFNERRTRTYSGQAGIEASGGEATVFRAGSVEGGGLTEEINNAFRKERDAEYAASQPNLMD